MALKGRPQPAARSLTHRIRIRVKGPLIMNKSLFSVLFATSASLCGTGCFWVTTKSEGDTLRANVKSLDGRLATKEQALDDQINQLKKVLEDSAKVLKRNNADIGADLDGLRKDVQVATGLVTTINNTVNELRASNESQRRDTESRLVALEQRLTTLETGKAPSNASADELWRIGSTAFEAKRFPEAVDAFKRLVQTYPTHDRADDAQYFRAQALYNAKQYDDAIREFQRLYEKYADSSLTDDGLYFAALAAEQLKNCTEARTYLAIIKEKFAKSNVAKVSDEADKRIKANKGSSKCGS